MATLKANGIEIAYEVYGDDTAETTLVFSHSLASAGPMWKPQIEALQDQYRLITYDTRGHGGTEVTPPPYTLDMLADDAIALMEALNPGPVVFCGLSMGGMVAQSVALKRPDLLKGLVIADSFSTFPEAMTGAWAECLDLALDKGMAVVEEATIERWFSPEFTAANSAAVAPVRKMILSTPVEGYIGCSQAIMAFDVLAQIPRIKVPTLVICGRQDPATTLAMSEATAAAIPGAALTVIENARHLSNIEQPQVFSRALVDFISG